MPSPACRAVDSRVGTLDGGNGKRPATEPPVVGRTHHAPGCCMMAGTPPFPMAGNTTQTHRRVLHVTTG